MPDRFIYLLVERRRTVIAALALVTIFAATALPRMSFDNSVESWFLDSDPSLALYDEFTEIFRADQIVVVGFFADDVFDMHLLQLIDRVSNEAAGLAFVEHVQSITNSGISRRAGAIDAANFKDQILASPLQRSLLLAPHADATAIVIHYAREGDSFRQKREFVAALRKILSDATAGSGIDYAMTGGPVMADAGQARNSSDMKILIPLMILIIVTIAYLVFGRLALTLLPLIVVGIAVVWAYALMSIAGWPMTMITIILVPLILAVGVAHSIHIVARYRFELQRGLDHETSLKTSVTRLLKPCFFTSITTVVGLLSLLVSDLEPIHEFAVTAAVGVLAAFIVSVTLLPIMLLSMRPGDGRKVSVAEQHVSRLLTWLQHVGVTRPGRILALAIATGATFYWLAGRVDVGLDPMSWIRHDDPIRVETERIDDAFGGALSLEFLVTSPGGRLNEPATLRRMESFEAWLVANTTVTRTTSAADLVKEAARVARDQGIDGYALPRSKALTSALLDSIDRADELRPWVTPDYSKARIAARIPLSSAQQIVDEIPAIERRIVADFAGSGVDVQLTGHAVLTGLMQTHMLDSQLRSFTVALGVVSVIMVLLLRSVTLGLLAMVPNLLPIVVGLGAMTLFDIALNPATVMIAAVALGIVVDDTVHLMTEFERNMRGGSETVESIRSTVREVGRPVLITSVLLAAGFSTLILGSFLPTRQVGGLIALIAAAALVTDLIFLPALLRLLPVGLVRRLSKSGR